MPFLRLTRDRRGNEHTFLLHAEAPGAKARVLYWYRTAPDVNMGRPPLDEDAIRMIEDQHPGIEFDWPAILALSEVMTPEDEPREERPARKRGSTRGFRSEVPHEGSARGFRAEVPPAASSEQTVENGLLDNGGATADEPPPHPTTRGLLEELVGREIATRLRARHSEVLSRIHAHPADDPRVPGWLIRAEALDPDLWLTPDAILGGVQHADHLYEALRHDLRADAPPGHS